MEMVKRRSIVGLALWAVVAGSLPSEAANARLKEGNRLFKNGKYERALKVYNDALVDAPHSSILHFNAGDAAYQMGDLPKAQKEFEEAAQSALPALKGASQYNRGNAFFQQGQWAQAIEAYKESLRANPADEDAKYNLGVALRAQKERPSSSQGSPQDNKKGGGKDKDEKKNKGDGQQPSAAEPKPGQMSKEDAERLLAAARAGELKKSNQRPQKGDAPHPDEDW
jgi:Ca-activated chloride channel family protein